MLQLREPEFVTAIGVLGVRAHDIVGRHMLPNLVSPLTVVATFGVAEAILRERALLALLHAACVQMDETFWLEASGDRNAVLSAIADQDLGSLVDFNYGPWDRRQENAPLVPGVGPKPAGACFYPPGAMPVR